MKNVSSKKLKNVVSTIECGQSAKISTADYNNEKFCYRIYKYKIDKWIINNIGKLTEEEFSDDYLKPIYMVDKGKGTLSKFAEGAQDLNFLSGVSKQIRYLKIAKKLVQNLHTEYKYIHGDISASNIIVNDEEVKTYLCDFDTAIKIGKEPKNLSLFSLNLYPYLQYYKFDEKLDIYKFNLMTLAVLLNKFESEVFSLIEQNQLGEFSEDKYVKRFAKELLLYNNRKPYSGEFIIDYIDDYKYRY